jgi:hypothetical protein
MYLNAPCCESADDAVYRLPGGSATAKQPHAPGRTGLLGGKISYMVIPLSSKINRAHRIARQRARDRLRRGVYRAESAELTGLEVKPAIAIGWYRGRLLREFRPRDGPQSDLTFWFAVRGRCRPGYHCRRPRKTLRHSSRRSNIVAPRRRDGRASPLVQPRRPGAQWLQQSRCVLWSIVASRWEAARLWEGPAPDGFES